MNKLTKEDKIQLLAELKVAGWRGCLCDICLLVLAEKVLEYQWRKE